MAVNRTIWLAAMGLVLIGFVAGGLAFCTYRQDSGHIPPLKVVGDVAQVVKLKDPGQFGKLHRISHNGQKYRAIKLTDIITAARPVASLGQIYLVGGDGFTSSFSAQGLDKSYIAFSAQNGWEAINLNHPVNSNVKMLKEIVLVAREAPAHWGLTVIGPDKDIARITPGQLYTRAWLEYPYAEGRAEVEKEGKTYASSVYTRRKVFRLADLTPLREGEMMLLMGADGEYRFRENRGYFELRDNYINYLQEEERSQLDQVVGVIIDPPAASIMDVYYDARRNLENGRKVLVMVVPALTYSRYTAALEKGALPFVENIGAAVKASGVYPLEDRVWLAAMITGKAPQENGIVSAGDQELKAPSLFALAQRLKKSALLLQPGAGRLNTEVEPVLVNDQNASGTADDELFAATLGKLEQDHDFIMLCFDGIAGSIEGHGDDCAAAAAAISATDKYLQDIVSKWPGEVIITGSPGNAAPGFSCDSMFVPYLYLK